MSPALLTAVRELAAVALLLLLLGLIAVGALVAGSLWLARVELRRIRTADRARGRRNSYRLMLWRDL